MIEEGTWAWLEISQTKQFRNERLRALSSRATRGICFCCGALKNKRHFERSLRGEEPLFARHGQTSLSGTLGLGATLLLRISMD